VFKEKTIVKHGEAVVLSSSWRRC